MLEEQPIGTATSGLGLDSRYPSVLALGMS